MNGMDYYGGRGDAEMDNMSGGIVGGQSLDDIVNQNAKVMRRRSAPLNFSGNRNGMDGDPRRVSMMEFSGASPGGVLDAFQFDPSATRPGIDGMMRTGDSYSKPDGVQQGRRASHGQLLLDTQFPGQNSPYASMAPPGSAYASPLHASAAMDMDISSPYVTSSFPMQLDMKNSQGQGIMGNEMASYAMYSRPQFSSSMMNSPVNQDFSNSMTTNDQDPGGGSVDMKGGIISEGNSSTPDQRISHNNSKEQSSHSNSRPQGSSVQPQQTSTPAQNVSFAPEPTPQQQLESQNNIKFPWTEPSGEEPNGNFQKGLLTNDKSTIGGFPSTMHGRPHMQTSFKDVYSSTGFDMLKVLMKVATRPNPKINIGSVDLSCAFVVCDAEKEDNPIVYCSENFERLTGYTRHMILGRNCRFLQSPDGHVEAGVKRKYVDDDSVLYLKNMINMRREAQISLINYRRGGQPFMNLLTMIPVAGDDNADIKFFVGFQVDLVEQPNSVTNKNPDGSYSINYQRTADIPKYIFNTPDQHLQLDLGATMPRDEVSTVLCTLGTGESELSRRIWDKVLLENTDDVVHVLSLKGLFLYLSPSSRKVLEYDPSELIGTALSSVCHPSDIVPVTRELKDTSSGASVNVVFRIRRKYSGYMWFEGHGSLHTEQGKGRKCIILVGRERPVYTLTKTDILSAGGIGDNELWTKMSTSGMFLFVSSNVRSLLDRQPDELVGTSIQALMRQDSKHEFGRILSHARVGKKASVKHEMINKRGQVLQAFTSIYPGDAAEGQKPTFVIAQTRLLKFSRGGSAAAQRPPIYPKPEQKSNDSIPLVMSGSNAGTTGGRSSLTGNSTPKSGISGSHYISTEGTAATYSGQNGLAIGHQDASLASEDNAFDELKTTRSTSWQFELRQMEKRNRMLAEEVQSLLAAKKKRKRRKGAGNLQKDCANCHTRVTPEWRRGPSGNRDLCNSCGLRWAKQNSHVSPRTPSQQSVASAQSDKASKASASPCNQPTMANKNEMGNGSSIPSATDNITSPQQQNANSHAAKVARMEVAASQGLSNGVPPKIDEGIEPD